MRLTPSNHPPPDFAAWCDAHRTRVEAALARVLPSGELPAGRLLEAMRYGALGGGKRLRALLAYASAEAVGAHVELADPAAVAVELIHAYSLIHDDLPCMDDDRLRRGKPTNHVVFGEATAMLAGDAMQPLAFAALTAMPASAEGRIRAVAELAQASGAAGMAGGQAIDLANVGRAMTIEALTEMHRLKTGAMVEAAVVLPALAVEVDETTVASLRAFAQPLGLAFQIIDDVLDATADTATLGKTAGKDAADDKPTFVSLLGIDAARAEAARLTGAAIDALDPLASAGRAVARLTALAQAMATRTH